ncbi:MAG TPA: hypothetical protein VFX70_10460 [Mycobacteriales bacterium]|nr:hypothetical protein [Mycobacteriales bacterium]
MSRETFDPIVVIVLLGGLTVWLFIKYRVLAIVLAVALLLAFSQGLHKRIAEEVHHIITQIPHDK